MLVEDLAPAVSAAVIKLKPGEITDPLRLGNGYRIFNSNARSPKSRPSTSVATRSRSGSTTRAWYGDREIPGETPRAGPDRMEGRHLQEDVRAGAGEKPRAACDPDRRRNRASGRARPNGGHDRYRVPPPGQAPRRLGLVVTEMVSSGGLFAASIARWSTRNSRKRNGRSRFRSSAAILKSWLTPPRSSRASAPTSSTSTWDVRSRRLPNTMQAAA